jgi:hypothetical protein
MNRTLKRPMFRIGGSPSEGITSGLDRPRMASADMDMKIKQLTQAYDSYRKQGGTLSFEEFSRLYAEENFNSGGRVGYQTGGFSAAGLPGFLTQFGLNLLSTPPQGGLLSTAALAARDPFNRLQATQAAAAQTASDRAFAKELAREEREFEEGQLTRKLQSAERIAAQDEDVVPEDLLKKYEGNQIKAKREQDFYTTVFKDLENQYGKESVSTSVIDSSEIPDKQIERFVKSNPQLARQVVYDVATGKAVRFVRNTQTNKFEIIPADPLDIDDTGDAMPEPKTGPDFTYLSEGQQETLKNIREASDSDFGLGFYE